VEQQRQGQAARRHKAFTQRLFLMSRNDGSATAMEFGVLSSEGSRTYRVRIDSDEPRCSCMDQRTRKLKCKHMLFVLLRVLNMEETHPFFTERTGKRAKYARALRRCTSALALCAHLRCCAVRRLTVAELRAIHRDAPRPADVPRNLLRYDLDDEDEADADGDVDMAAAASEKKRAKKKRPTASVAQRPIDMSANACPICFEPFVEDGTGLLLCTLCCGFTAVC
jgi:hypothetical protein